MRIDELLKWQWDGYSKFHQSRSNLLIHIIFVPLFVIGFILFLVSLVFLKWPLMLSALLLMVMSFALQGVGHGKEQHSAVPFSGFRNAVLRILFEQLYTFPKFVLTGEWYKAFVKSSA